MNNMDFNITIPDGWEKNYEDNKKIEDLLIYQRINIGIGSGGIFINCVLLSALISSKYFIKHGGLIILLCIGDLANCLRVFLQGYIRSNMYTFVLAYQIHKIQTYWSCALFSCNWMGLLGSLIPHIVTLVMGIERIVALKFPVIYKKHFNGMTTAFVLAYMNRNVITKYWCGRKASYTNIYVVYIYIMNIIGYVVCFILTVIVLYHVKLSLKLSLNKKKSVTKQKNTVLNDQEKRDLKTYQRVKTIAIISFVSSVTISFPSFISLLSLAYKNLSVIMSDPSDWVSVFKSSINFFVYLFMNNEFKAHLFGNILNIAKYKQNFKLVAITKITVMNTKKRLTVFE
ncbi:Hypothetical protein SRAE_2000428500 [Strongyloides ratti]|uniref:G-protein coupled receptors family 1 profile domain-containing protein n=1 Tax=Strongyloides ratti TaxID=34506 RepID=A0A090LIR7_STRRB|nr:Hypothetical protein SRAE_2000428500 [Strongyloides ratti]CEF69638.1 Hypothetical protein SRAE_2000428500 [Strongyloides ratti]